MGISWGRHGANLGYPAQQLNLANLKLHEAKGAKKQERIGRQ